MELELGEPQIMSEESSKPEEGGVLGQGNMRLLLDG